MTQTVCGLGFGGDAWLTDVFAFFSGFPMSFTTSSGAGNRKLDSMTVNPARLGPVPR